MALHTFVAGDVLEAQQLNDSFAAVAGVTLISATTISAAATTNVNDVFSATYDNYQIIFNGTASTGTNAVVSMRLRVSGSDANTGYEYERLNNYSTTVSADRNVIGTDEWYICETNASAKYFFESTIMAPFSAAPTKFLHRYMADTSVTGTQGGLITGYNSNSTSYSGFSLISTGTITGTLKIYGMKN